jgi:hypothetical protein
MRLVVMMMDDEMEGKEGSQGWLAASIDMMDDTRGP